MSLDVRLLKPNESDLLQQVVELADSNKAWLGFMPEQAFAPFAKNKNIIVAISGNTVIGYLLFRRVSSKFSAAITHLCINKTCRGQKIPEKLFSLLKEIVQDVSNISLKCRRDYTHASKMWQRLGFIPRNETKGRSLDRKPLTRWYYSLNSQLGLFSNIDEIDDKLNVVIDANVFYDLCNIGSSNEHKESHSLIADWLSDDIKIHITDEIYHEINRNNNTELRERNRRQATKYSELKYDKSIRNTVLSELKLLIPRSETARNISDLTHIANAITSKAHYFLTQDIALLDQQQLLFEKYGLLVRRPVDLIVDIDELKNNNKYLEARFVEHHISYSSIKSSDINSITHEFANSRLGESINSLRNSIRIFVSKPEEFHSELWRGNGNSKIPHAAVAWRTNAVHIEVVLLRAKDAFSKLTERKIKSLIILAAKEDKKYITITDQYLSDRTKSLLEEYRFYRDPADNNWHRFISSGSGSMSLLSKKFQSHLQESNYLPSPVKTLFLEGNNSTDNIFQAERFFWPYKIKEANVACYIVPIQPRWARSLFDEQMSEEDIFGFDSSLLFSRRNVYYRSAVPRVLSKGRVLWYVSKEGNKYGQVRAASYIDNVTISSAKRIFSKYESLGTYKWDDVKKLAKGNADNPIMGFEFSDTETLSNPISFSELQSYFIASGRPNNQLVAPVEISHDLYMKIYEAGC